jgi:phosphatidylglycerol:prolipoprotein diacylglycerol transferase
MYPILFKIGNFPIHSWGVLLMLGFVLAVYRAVRNGWRYHLPAEAIWDIALISLIGGVVGGRLVYVALNWVPHYDSLGHYVSEGYRSHPAEIFAVWAGGMTSFGGFAGGILAGVIACRLRKIDVGDMADLFAVSFPIGYGIGRIGCFLNGCCYGGQCDLPWAVKFRWDDGIVRASHPTQLYSVIASVIMFALLLPLERHRKFRGQLMLAFLFLYGIYRFITEFFREGATASVTDVAHLTQAQIACLLLSFLTLGFYIVLQSRPQPDAARTAPVA